jgi:diamine N-acetyltransferase
MSVTLRELTKANYEACIRLKVAEDQRGFVAPNVNSIAEAYVYRGFVPLAICDDEQVVGFLMYGDNEESGKPFYVIRLMVDEQHQGRGYGTAAMQEAIRRMKAQPECTEIYTSYVPENEVAAKLYERLGFRPTGEMEDDEIVVCLTVDR